ncbi:unnamed protein product [Lepeophtheirus salmonis]|uniref:(salmon louse) hypothetical protein n=1 Tax=Lepeophtheirus salmonis TaxID=72036 RepID=A0A7R8CI65_LEPSM|nr:unnamed protein product [Lepeophtheirus salmonis]CAF2792670.1 unnamed protein product [Lepeophtheirus salmonis]
MSLEENPESVMEFAPTRIGSVVEPSRQTEAHQSISTSHPQLNPLEVVVNTFEDDVFDNWSYNALSDDFIRELLSDQALNQTSTEEDLGPFVDPRDLNIAFEIPPKEEKQVESNLITINDIKSLTPLDATIQIKRSPQEQQSTESAQEKKPRGRPIGSATKSRVVPVPQSVNEAKYLRTRELNNEASRRCRMNRKTKLEVMLGEVDVLCERNAQLKEQVRVKEDLIGRLKSKLIAMASSSVTPVMIPL